MQLTFEKIYTRLIFTVSLLILLTFCGCKHGGIFSRESTIYGTITELSGAPVDSIKLSISAYKGLGNEKPLMVVSTDKDGKYEAVVDVPSGYGSLLIGIPYPGNPAFTTAYSGYEVYKEGERTNDCCSAKIGGKTRYDFKVYK